MLVLTSPSGSVRHERMSPLAAGTDRWEARALLDEQGVWHWHVTGFDDEIATWRHDAALKIDAGVDAELMFEIGARLLDRRRRREVASARHATPTHARSPPRCATTRHPSRNVARSSTTPSLDDVRRLAPGAAHHRLARARDPRRAPTRGRRLVVRVLPALRGRTAPQGRHLEERHLPHRGEAPRRRRRHGLRRGLPAADPPDRRHEPQGAQQHARPGPERSGLAVGDRRGGGRPRRRASRPRHARRLPRVRAPGRARSASRSRSTSRCRPPPTTRG